MKFTSRADISAPAEAVFDHLADLTTYAAEARRRGVVLRRTDALAAPGPGMSWEIDFRFRGRQRQMALRASRFLRPSQIDYDGQSNNFDLTASMQVIALAPARARLHLAFELRPRTLGARLLLQSARLGRARIESRINERVAVFAVLVEERLLAV